MPALPGWIGAVSSFWAQDDGPGGRETPMITERLPTPDPVRAAAQRILLPSVMSYPLTRRPPGRGARRQVRGHHRIVVIRLTGTTQDGTGPRRRVHQKVQQTQGF